MNTKHAVLYYDGKDGDFLRYAHIMWIEGKGFQQKTLIDPCYTLQSLAELAYPQYITHLWVPPGYGEFPTQESYGEWSFKINTRNKKMAAANVWQRGKRSSVQIIFPENTAWFGILDTLEAHDLLITLHYLETTLGITIGSSPGRVGWNYLKKLHPEWIEEIPGVNLKECHFVPAAAPDIIWQRFLHDIEKGKLFVHKFDRGAAFPYAGSQTDVGTGTPVHVNHGHDARHEKGHPQAVGVWKVNVKYNSTHYRPDMPPTWGEEKGTHAGTEGWLSGPIIRLLRSQGHDVAISEGWVFPQRHDVLVRWGKDLWEKRQGFLDAKKWINQRCAKVAAKATKRIMNTTVGMTAFRGFTDDDDMKRPDIRVQVIARHREITWHNINKVRTLYGATPVIVNVDALYYVSDEPNGRKAFPELVKREGEFGGYRWEGRIPMSEAYAVLDGKMAVWEKLSVLNKIGWVQE